MFQQNYLTWVDYIVIAFTLLLPVLIGVYHGVKSKHTTEDVLMGNRGMSLLPVAASIMVTFFSAISILGFPAEVYNYGVQIFMLSITTCIFSPISAYLFVPVLYELQLTSSFEYFQHRFDSVLLRQIASSMFILFAIVMQSVVVYAPSIALESIIGIPMWLSILGLGIVCTVYTAMGGFKAVIWTDFFQLVILMVGMIIIMVRAMYLSGGFVETFRIAAENGRLNLIDFTFDPFVRHNVWNFIFGFGVKTVLTMGTHQNQVQRYSSVPTQKIAIQSILLSLPFNILANAIIIVTGLSIYAVYVNCDPIKEGTLQKADQIVPYFVVQHLSVLPGILGLFLSCVFCAVLSTFSSMLNSMAAVLWEDFLIDMPVCKDLSPKTKANISRGFALVFGIVAIGLAFLGPMLGPVLTVTLSAVGAFSGPVGSLFVLGIFVPFANKFGVIAGLFCGLVSTFGVIIQSFFLPKFNPALPTSIEQCTNSSMLYLGPMSSAVEIEWPDKFFTLSYLLYSTLGATVTLTVGIIVSLVTGGLSTMKNIKSIYVHSMFRQKVKLKPGLSRRQASIRREGREPSLVPSANELELDAILRSAAFKSGRFNRPRVSDGEIVF